MTNMVYRHFKESEFVHDEDSGGLMKKMQIIGCSHIDF
jgi:hypothetical protein